MRYIAERDVFKVLPDDWRSKAQQKIEELKLMTHEARRESINSGAQLWSEIKDKLADCSNGKCWYCESIESRSDNTVDHFRPKGRVAECADHEGYWWLAFDWHNYRYSCTFCNSRRHDKDSGLSGGKQDNFPLLDESKRAKLPSDDIDCEQPLLLDPLCASDPQLLWFQEDGDVVPKYVGNDEFNLRATTSIELFHLNHAKVKERRKIIGNEVQKTVEMIDRYFYRYFEEGDTDAKTIIRREFANLRGMISPAAEFSAAARAYLNGLRTNEREWIGELLLQA